MCIIQLGYCVKSRNAAGLIPDVLIRIFHRLNSSGRTTALGLAQLLTEMSRVFPGV